VLASTTNPSRMDASGITDTAPWSSTAPLSDLPASFDQMDLENDDRPGTPTSTLHDDSSRKRPQPSPTGEERNVTRRRLTTYATTSCAGDVDTEEDNPTVGKLSAKGIIRKSGRGRSRGQ
jgi:hypothetical protein